MLTAAEAARAIAEGDLTCEAVAAACIERIEAQEDTMKGWAYFDRDAALAAARAADKGPSRGILHGVPFALKDIIDTADMPTGHGSPIYDGYRPGWDAPCVAACRDAGAILFGKTVSAEFAHVQPGPTRNPYNPGHTPGGSSSGSAAVVGAGMVPAAFGTQTTGSTIRPAAFCGTVGYKPSYGDFCLTGVRDNSPSLDTLGLITRSVEDLALFRSAAMVLPYKPLVPVSLTDLRIGFCRTPWWDEAEGYTKDLLTETMEALSRAGAQVTDFTMPDGADGLVEAMRDVSGFEFARVMLHERLHHHDQLSERLLNGRVADGIACSYDGYRAALATLEDYRANLSAAMADFDLLLTPSASGEAPEGIESTGNPVFNLPWTATYTPAVTLPAASGPSGLPLGVQLIGHRNQDHRFLSAAQAVEHFLDDLTV
ncbi:MAG: amidase [Alphaproteobacteria bacterium]|nr:amidase [Alphaproteobacteria bacterium]